MPASVWIVNLVVLAAVLQADLGYRKITTRRLLRPVVIAAVVAAFYLRGASGSGNGLWLELEAVGAGILLGLVASALMRVSVNPDGSAYSRAGVPYAVLWVAVVGARLWFAYGSNHEFSRQLGSWLVTERVTGDVLVRLADLPGHRHAADQDRQPARAVQDAARPPSRRARGAARCVGLTGGGRAEAGTTSVPGDDDGDQRLGEGGGLRGAARGLGATYHLSLEGQLPVPL